MIIGLRNVKGFPSITIEPELVPPTKGHHSRKNNDAMMKFYVPLELEHLVPEFMAKFPGSTIETLTVRAKDLGFKHITG